MQDLESSIFKPFVWRIKEVLVSTWKKSTIDLFSLDEMKQTTSELCEFSWEKIHFSGHWTSVQPIWRDCYALGKIVMVVLQLFELFALRRRGQEKQRLLQCIKDLDLALMIGANTFRAIIHDLVNDVHDMMIFVYGVPLLVQNVVGTELLKDDPTPPPPKKQKTSFKIESESIIEPFCSGTPIPRVDASKFSIHDFVQQFVITKKPVIIENHISHWPAYTKWSNACAYLNQVAGYRAIPVEIGSNYVSEEWTQTILTMNEYIKKYLMHNETSFATLNEKTTPKKGYLAQHPLFDQIEQLKRDIMEPDYLGAFDGDLKHVNAWIGPKGTVSPLHTDPYHNLFVQIVGNKYVRLYTQDKAPYLYVHKDGLLTNSSQIQHFFDSTLCSQETYPLFYKLNENGQNYWDAIVQKGDILYIPPMMWHYVQSCSLSMSISYWT